jgi:transglutaminase-like putative cysteine protease
VWRSVLASAPGSGRARFLVHNRSRSRPLCRPGRAPGVCRDFAHLAITLCRCLSIPARYTNGYLGDMGVPFNPAPMTISRASVEYRLRAAATLAMSPCCKPSAHICSRRSRS